ALPYSKVADFWTKLRDEEGMGARALELAVLTATRTGEVLGARWDEIDLKAKLWIIPTSRTKAGIEHRVPLSDAAVRLLKAAEEARTGDLVFPGRNARTPLSNM